MKKLLLLCALVLSPVVRSADAPSAPASAALSLAPLASLVGGTWVGELPVPQGQPPVKIELRFAWTENRRGIRFDSAFVGLDKRAPYTSGLYAWDGAKQKWVIFYVSKDGELTEGTISLEGEVLVNELTVTEASGNTYPVRVRLTKSGDDVFTNAIFLKNKEEWAPFVAVKYVRRK